MQDDVVPAQRSDWANFILGQSPDDFWVWTIIILGIGLACGYGTFYFIRRARIIEDTPTSRIRSASQGYVELIGTIKYFTSQAVFAPLTGQACAWYHYKIEKRETVHTGKSSHTRWRTIKEEFCSRVFACVDETGMCMVDPRGAEVHCVNENTWYGSNEWPAKGPSGKRSFFTMGSYRYTERRLHENESLYAIGNFRTVDPNKAHGDIQDEVRAILKVWKQDQPALLAKFDTDNNGEIDLQEWEAVRQAAQEKAYQQRLSRADRPAISILTKTDDFRRPFILSVRPPERMVSSYKLKAAACTAGFVLLTPLAIWMIILRLST